MQVPSFRYLVFLHTRILMLMAWVMMAVLEGCSTTRMLPLQQPSSAAENIASTKLGKDISVSYNESNTLALYQQKPGEADHALRTYKYLVIRLSDNAIVHEGSFRAGYVKWADNTSVEVYSQNDLKSEKDSDKKIIPVNSGNR